MTKSQWGSHCLWDKIQPPELRLQDPSGWCPVSCCFCSYTLPGSQAGYFAVSWISHILCLWICFFLFFSLFPAFRGPIHVLKPTSNVPSPWKFENCATYLTVCLQIHPLLFLFSSYPWRKGMAYFCRLYFLSSWQATFWLSLTQLGTSRRLENGREKLGAFLTIFSASSSISSSNYIFCQTLRFQILPWGLILYRENLISRSHKNLLLSLFFHSWGF